MPEKVRKSRQAPEKGPGKYQKRLDPGEYRKGEIWASIRNVRFGRVPKRWDPGKYRNGGIRASTKKVKSG